MQSFTYIQRTDVQFLRLTGLTFGKIWKVWKKLFKIERKKDFSEQNGIQFWYNSLE